jgi:cadmium resistance protein CadD (predicted permease)
MGLLPICLGLCQIGERLDAAALGSPDQRRHGQESSSGPELPGMAVAGALGVASITVANGSDNIGVYLPMFASHGPSEVVVTLGTFALMTGLWCQIAWWLTRAPGLATVLQRYGDALLPVVLIGIGGLILHDSHTLERPPLAVLTLTCLAGMAISLARQVQALLEATVIRGVPQ